MKCVFCDAELNKDNDSLEHIIPNSLGGKLKSKNIMCKSCNNTLGETVDINLYNNFKFIDFMVNPLKDRNTKSSYIKAKIGDDDIQLYPGFKYYSKPIIDLENIKNHKISVSQIVSKRNENDNEKLLKILKKLASKYYPKAKYKIKIENTTLDTRTISNTLCIDFPYLILGYLKIALCFCRLNNKENLFDGDFLKLKNKIINLCKNKSDYDKNKLSFHDELIDKAYIVEQNTFQSGYLTHRIHLVCDDVLQKAFIVVGIYDFLHIAFVLNDNYIGEKYRVDYIFDILTAREIKSDICLGDCLKEKANMNNLQKHIMNNMHYPLSFKSMKKESTFNIDFMFDIFKDICIENINQLSFDDFKSELFGKIKDIRINNADFRLMNDLNIDELTVVLYPIYKDCFNKINKIKEYVLENFSLPKEVFDFEDESIKQELHRMGVEAYFNHVLNGDDDK
ncbi:HNH endonuclease [Campylobacter sp. MG1]|uniref:HNH endonuclease n=1 Tax=Campylobacter sp. MG1 TaxID=2976332 RepID=UPI00226D0657|nr:HNH endonuclease [Campylobacter sp. MG1]